MGRRSKKSKKRKPLSAKKKKPGKTEDVAYYFLAAIGIVIIALVIATILGFLGII
jgi:hypothetical protein